MYKSHPLGKILVAANMILYCINGEEKKDRNHPQNLILKIANIMKKLLLQYQILPI